MMVMMKMILFMIKITLIVPIIRKIITKEIEIIILIIIIVSLVTTANNHNMKRKRHGNKKRYIGRETSALT